MATVPRIPTFQSGIRMHSGDTLNELAGPLASIMGQAGAAPINFPLVRYAVDNLTAKAGGGQAGATALPAEINRLTTVATAADSVMLPASVAGLAIVIINSGAASAQVYGTGNDTINAAGAAAGVPQAAGKVAVYYCPSAGKWFQMLSA